VLDGLDALGQDHRVGPLGVGPDAVDDVGRLGGGAAPQQPHVQLDQVGADERQHGQAGRRGPDVVQGRVAGHRPLGDLDDHPQAGLAGLDDLVEVVGAGDAEGDRLGVDEQGQGRAESAADGPGEGGRPAGPVELGHPARPPGGAEHGRRRLQGRAHRPPGQRLVAEDVTVVEIDHGLEDRLHGPLVEDPAEVLGRRRGGMGDSRRTHGGLIDHWPAGLSDPDDRSEREERP